MISNTDSTVLVYSAKYMLVKVYKRGEMSPAAAAWGWSDTFRPKLARNEEDLKHSLALDTIDVEIAVERNDSRDVLALSHSNQ
jgi:hypothetical protein